MILPESVPSFRPPLYASPQRLINGQLPPTKGHGVAAWAERWVPNGHGDSLGVPLRLAPHQRYMLNRIFEYDPETSRLLYSHVVIIIGKGNSKTQDAALIGVAETYGPVRPLRSPLVVVQAASYEQADNVYGTGRAMIENGPLASRFATFDHMLYPHVGGGRMIRKAAKAGTSDGALPTCAIGDELHEWKSETQKNIYTVQGANLRKRQVPRHGGISGSLQISISTPGDDLDSLLGDLYQHGVKVATGEVEDPRFLFLCWEAPKAKDEDLDDPIQLREAILAANPAVGHFLTTEQLEEAYHDVNMERHQYERRHLARWVSNPNAWIFDAAWKARAAEHGDPPDGTRIVVGFKGSYDRNVTALVAWTVPAVDPERPPGMADGDYADLCAAAHAWDDYGFVLAQWEPDGKDPDWTVPRDEVDAAVYKAMTRWRVEELVCDPVGWVTEIEAWEKEFGVRTVDKDDRAKGRGTVLKFEVGVNARMGPACDRFKSDVLDPESTFRHSGDLVLARHIKNAHRRATRYGAVIDLDKKGSPRQIALAQAAVIARQRAMHQPKPRKRGIAAGF